MSRVVDCTCIHYEVFDKQGDLLGELCSNTPCIASVLRTLEECMGDADKKVLMKNYETGKNIVEKGPSTIT